MSSAPQHPFETLSELDEDILCPVCMEAMLPCLSFGCHQICRPCAGSLPNKMKRKCPTCNRVSKELPTRNAMITNLVEKAVAGQLFRCCLCQEILTGPVERDAHPPVCAAAEQPKQQQRQQQQEQQQQLAPPPPRPRPIAPSEPVSGAAPAAVAAPPSAAAAASSSSVFTKPCAECKELLPRRSFTKAQWTRKDGAFRCTNCVRNEQQAAEQQRRREKEEQQAAEQQRHREKEQQKLAVQQRRREQEEQRRREEDEQRRRKEEEQRRAEEQERRSLEQEGAALIAAVSDGSVDTVRSLVAHPDFARFRHTRNSKDRWTALHKASAEGHIECARALLEGGCDITLTDSDGRTAVFLAAWYGNADVLRMLIAHPESAKIRNLCSKDGWTPLRAAAGAGKAECAQVLLDAGCDMTIVDDAGYTTLHLAALMGNADVVRVLVNAPGAAQLRDLRSKDCTTPLQVAALNGNVASVRALLDGGCDICIVDTRSGQSVLHIAVLHDKFNFKLVDRGGLPALSHDHGHGNADIVRLLAAHADFAKVRDLRDKNGGTALLWASHKGHTECVRALLEAGADIAVGNSEGQTALHLVAHHGNVDILRMLLSAPGSAKVRDLRDKDGGTALHAAAFEGQGHTECARALLEAGCDISVVDSDGVTALHVAARGGEVDVLHLLAAHPDFAKVRDLRGNDSNDSLTALSMAAEAGHVECVRALLEGGCDIALADSCNGLTALHRATGKGHIDVVRVLASDPNFAKVRDLRDTKKGYAALHWASACGHTECARALLNGGCDIAVVSNEGQTALHHAAIQGKVGAIRLLVAHSDFAKVRDLRDTKNGSTALHFASNNGHTECVQALLNGGCDVTVVMNDGSTAMHHAAGKGNVDIVRLFAAHPNFAKVRDLRDAKNGGTALHWASACGHTECVWALLEAGCDISVVSNDGGTALHVAARGGEVDVLHLLVAHPDFAKVRDLRSNDGRTALDLAETAEKKKILRS